MQPLLVPFIFALAKFSHYRPPVEAVRLALTGKRFAEKILIGVLDGKHLLLRPEFEVNFLRIRASST